MKSPSVLFYTANFLGGTGRFTDEQAGQYIRALCDQAENGHFTTEQLMVFLKSKSSPVWKKFQQDADGLWYNERMRHERAKSREYSESRRSNVLRRYEKAAAPPATPPAATRPQLIDGDLPTLPIQVLEHYNAMADMWRAAGVVVESRPAMEAYSILVRGAIDWLNCEIAGRNYLDRCKQEGRSSRHIKGLPSFLSVWPDWVNPPAHKAAAPAAQAADVLCRKCKVTKIKTAGGMCRACIQKTEDDAAYEKAQHSGGFDSPGARKFMEEVKKLANAKSVRGTSGRTDKYPCTECGKEHNDQPGAACRPCSLILIKQLKPNNGASKNAE